jgi:hypothetical protein
VAFIERQANLVSRLYQGERPDDLTLKEEILADLIQNERGPDSLLRSYIHNFLAIIAFDAERKGRLISQRELDWYANTLGRAVTDGIQYFICNGHPYPESPDRYLAATAAHITHMLRDTAEDIPAGYINIPREFLEEHGISLHDHTHPALRLWVKSRVELSRRYLEQGKRYLDSLEVLRCKIVGYWYCARFEKVLDAIERDGYVLQASYAKPPKAVTWMKFAGLALLIALQHSAAYLSQNACWATYPQKKEQPLQTVSANSSGKLPMM